MTSCANCRRQITADETVSVTVRPLSDNLTIVERRHLQCPAITAE